MSSELDCTPDTLLIMQLCGQWLVHVILGIVVCRLYSYAQVIARHYCISVFILLTIERLICDQ